MWIEHDRPWAASHNFWMATVLEFLLFLTVGLGIPTRAIRAHIEKVVARLLETGLGAAKGSLDLSQCKSIGLLVYWADLLLCLLAVRWVQLLERTPMLGTPAFVDLTDHISHWASTAGYPWQSVCAVALTISVLGRGFGWLLILNILWYVLPAVYWCHTLYRIGRRAAAIADACPNAEVAVEQILGDPKTSFRLVAADCGMWTLLAAVAAPPDGYLIFGLYLLTGVPLIEDLMHSGDPLIAVHRDPLAGRQAILIVLGAVVAAWLHWGHPDDSATRGLLYGWLMAQLVVVVAWRSAERLAQEASNAYVQRELAEKERARAEEARALTQGAFERAEKQKSVALAALKEAEKARVARERQSDSFHNFMHNVAHTARAGHTIANVLRTHPSSEYRAGAGTYLSAAALDLVAGGVLAGYAISFRREGGQSLRPKLYLAEAPGDMESLFQPEDSPRALVEIAVHMVLFYPPSPGHQELMCRVLGCSLMPNEMSANLAWCQERITAFADQSVMQVSGHNQVALQSLAYDPHEFTVANKRASDFRCGLLACISELIVNALTHGCLDRANTLFSVGLIDLPLGQTILAFVVSPAVETYQSASNQTGTGLEACEQFANVFEIRFVSSLSTNAGSRARAAQILEEFGLPEQCLNAFEIPVCRQEDRDGKSSV